MNPIVKGIGAGLGIGGTAMYMGNEGPGETFTSYPREARYKQLMRGDQVPLPGLENHVYKNYGEWSSGPINRNPDGSADARRESTWLGTMGKLALGAMMLAPWMRGITTAGIAVAGAVSRNPQRVANVVAERTKRGVEAIPGVAKNIAADPKAAGLAAVDKASGVSGRIFKTYNDYYANQLNKARDYFGV